MTDVTQILNTIEQGDAQAADKLLPLVYGELRLLAAQKLSREPPGQTLEATALVHEAYIRLVDQGPSWSNRGHFFAAAAEAMNLGPLVNSSSKACGPCLSPDGLLLFFQSQRSGGSGLDDIWMSMRANISDEWSQPVNLGSTVNSLAHDYHPDISHDGSTLYFTSLNRSRRCRRSRPVAGVN